MTTSSNGGTSRTWKAGDPEPTPPPPPTPAPHRPDVEPVGPRREPGVSGRRFVIWSVVVIALLWLVVFAILRPALINAKRRSEFGRKELAPSVLAMLQTQPPGVDPRVWDDAVRAGHALLATTTDAGTLTFEEMTALRDQVRAAADRARERPETAAAELASLWNDVAAIARRSQRPGEPDVDRRHPRPSILPAADGRESSPE